MDAAESFYWFCYRCATGRNVTPELDRLLREQYLPADQLAALQTSRLRALLEHAAAHVPHYRDLFRRIGFSPGDVRSVCDLPVLPPLERATVRDQPDQLLSELADRRKLHVAKTSGTTGQPVAVYHDARSVVTGSARYWRAYWAWGHRPGDRILRILRQPDVWTWKNRLRDALMKTLLNDCHWYMESESRAEIEHLVRVLRTWRPKMFRGYLDKLQLVAAFLEQTGARLHIPRIVSGASLLTDVDRKHFGDWLGDEVFDYYSSEELLSMAFECKAHSGLHVASESFVIEAMAGDRPAQPGELGEVFITGLTNFAMPLIRYRIGDTLTPVGAPCPCGRTLPLVRMTHGRILDILSTPDGRVVSPSAVLRPFRVLGASRIAQYQVVQETLHQLRIRVVKGPDFTPETEAALLRLFGELMGNEVRLAFEFPEAIPHSPRSKMRIVESQVPLRFDRPAGLEPNFRK